MSWILALFGRLHPLLVHLPIGILVVAFIVEALSIYDQYRKLARSVNFLLLLGIAAALISSLTGYILKQEGGYEENLIYKHQNFGFATTALALVSYFVRLRLKHWIASKQKRKQMKVLLFLPLIILISATGHYGGSLTHGEDYLVAVFDESDVNSLKSTDRIKSVSNPDSAVLYQDVVAPILKEKCYSCHSAKKQKGDLRLDGMNFIQRGGKHGNVIEEVADSSTLYTRLVLPLEAKEHMPPKEKTQLSSAETDIIKLWIDEGADFNKRVAHLQSRDKISQLITSIQYTSESWIPVDPVHEADQKAISALVRENILVTPAAYESNYLMVNFVNARTIQKDQLTILKEIREQLLWLNLGSTTIQDEDLSLVGELSSLRVLYLNNTQVSDKGISNLNALKKLIYLNLVGTKISDQALQQLSGMAELKHLYLFNTNVTAGGVARLKASLKEVVVDTGKYTLPKLSSDTIVHKRQAKAK